MFGRFARMFHHKAVALRVGAVGAGVFGGVALHTHASAAAGDTLYDKVRFVPLPTDG